MVDIRNFSPDALKEARISRGLNQTQLAERISISRQAISKFEQGESQPAADTFEKIVAELNFPARFFFKNRSNKFSKNTPTFHRKLKAASQYEKEKASAKADWAYEAFEFLNRFIKQQPLNLPDFISKTGYDFLTLSDDDIEDLAEELRRFWGLGLGPISKLLPLLERSGIIVAQFEMPYEIRAFSHYINRNPFIACSSEVSAAMNRHSLAHECAHLLLHKHIEQIEYQKHLDLIEKQADRFAGAFLFPRKSFCEEFYSTNIRYLTSLKQRWGVAISALLVRATQLGVLTPEEQTNIRRRNGGLRSREPLDDIMEIERPSHLPNGLKAIIEHRRSTLDEVKYVLPYHDSDLAEIFSIERSFFVGGKVSNTIEFKRKAGS